MRHENIRIADLSTLDSCIAAINDIESDSRNYTCSATQWHAGYDIEEYFKSAAKNKIAAINRKYDKLWDKWCDDNPELIDS